MFELNKPSTKHRIQAFDNMLNTIPKGALGSDSDALPQRFQAFLAHPAFPGFESIPQKLEALTRCRTISYMRLVRMKALTPVRLTLRTALPVYRTLPCDHSISNHLTHPCRSFHTLPLSSTGSLSTGRGFALLPASSPVTPGRIEFVILRTGRSPPVAFHPASRRRSYVWLQVWRAIDLKRTFTSLTSCAHGRTGSGFQPRKEVAF